MTLCTTKFYYEYDQCNQFQNVSLLYAQLKWMIVFLVCHLLFNLVLMSFLFTPSISNALDSSM